MQVTHFRTLSSVVIGTETLPSGSIVPAVQTDYMQALIDNGLVEAVSIDERGNVSKVVVERPQSLPNYGVLWMPCSA